MLAAKALLPTTIKGLLNWVLVRLSAAAVVEVPVSSLEPVVSSTSSSIVCPALTAKGPDTLTVLADGPVIVPEPNVGSTPFINSITV